ncbi:MAG TPA: radical SAM protein [Acidobacteriota bacterium]|nr:radical SAM protein [Acidobacteriota bacterium]
MAPTPEQPGLMVNEIFASIQGESTWAGVPCVFVRLTGCNLRCEWCDTAYAFYEGERLSIDAVIRRIDAFGLPTVEITGGEPLLQPGTAVLAEKLIALGRTVLVETSGASPIDGLPAGLIRIMDIKCPSSGESDRNHWPNIDHLTPADEVKFVIGDREDYDWARDVVARHDLTSRCTVLFAPVFGRLEPRELADWILADKPGVRLQLQIHKFIWNPEARAV